MRRCQIVQLGAVLAAALVPLVALAPAATRADLATDPPSPLVVRGINTTTRDPRGPRFATFRIAASAPDTLRVSSLSIGGITSPISRVELDGAAVGRELRLSAGAHRLKIFFELPHPPTAAETRWIVRITWSIDVGLWDHETGAATATITRRR